MSDHDPLCRQQHWDGGDCFDCRLIARVRADEREAWLLMAAIDKVQMADLRAKVEALHSPLEVPGERSKWVLRVDVLALLDGDTR